MVRYVRNVLFFGGNRMWENMRGALVVIGFSLVVIMIVRVMLNDFDQSKLRNFDREKEEHDA